MHAGSRGASLDELLRSCCTFRQAGRTLTQVVIMKEDEEKDEEQREGLRALCI